MSKGQPDSRTVMRKRLTQILTETIPEMDIDDVTEATNRQFAPEYSQNAYMFALNQ